MSAVIIKINSKDEYEYAKDQFRDFVFKELHSQRIECLLIVNNGVYALDYTPANKPIITDLHSYLYYLQNKKPLDIKDLEYQVEKCDKLVKEWCWGDISDGDMELELMSGYYNLWRNSFGFDSFVIGLLNNVWRDKIMHNDNFYTQFSLLDIDKIRNGVFTN